jgi:hypothetical protein
MRNKVAGLRSELSTDQLDSSSPVPLKFLKSKLLKEARSNFKPTPYILIQMKRPTATVIIFHANAEDMFDVESLGADLALDFNVSLP